VLESAVCALLVRVSDSLGRESRASWSDEMNEAASSSKAAIARRPPQPSLREKKLVTSSLLPSSSLSNPKTP